MKKVKICHVCKKEKKPYTVFLTDDILSLITHEQAREPGEICERCSQYFAMTGEFKDASKEEFQIAVDSIQFTSMMKNWWEKDKKINSDGNNEREWDGTHYIAKWYREFKSKKNCMKSGGDEK